VAPTLHASSPAIVGNISTASTALASFTPPSLALLVVGYAGNSTSGASPPAPTITDNLGTHLTYSLINNSALPDTPAGVNGQAAMWWANVYVSSAMTITCTNGDASNGQAVWATVWTDPVNGTIPRIGAVSEGGQATGTTVAGSYTAKGNGSRGVMAMVDWDQDGPDTAGTGTTLTGGGSSNFGTKPGAAFYTATFALRSAADGVAGSTTTLNITQPSASANVRWVAAEVMSGPPAPIGPVEALQRSYNW
jgi:hypothetical protein